jgi:hypothetical protein
MCALFRKSVDIFNESGSGCRIEIDPRATTVPSRCRIAPTIAERPGRRIGRLQ